MSLATEQPLHDFGNFSPDDYLDEYYHSVFSENDRLLDFFARAAEHIPAGSDLLEYGGGPTIYQVISFAPRVDSIHFSDYVDGNLKAVQDWVNKEETAHNWTPFVAAALRHESGEEPTKEDIYHRENLVRGMLSEFGHVDALQHGNDTLPAKKYDAVSVNFVAESISTTHEQWQTSLDSILGYLKDEGTLCMTAIRNATYWRSGGKQFPAYQVTREMLEQEIASRGFDIKIIEEIDAEVTDPASLDYEGYDGMVFIVATKK